MMPKPIPSKFRYGTKFHCEDYAQFLNPGIKVHVPASPRLEKVRPHSRSASQIWSTVLFRDERLKTPLILLVFCDGEFR